MLTLDENTYGKTGVRLTQVLRKGGRDEVLEIAVSVLFEGDFESSYAEADNSKVLPTDTIKNTVYVVARQHPIESIETFALDLARHFLSRLAHLHRVRVHVEQAPWSRIDDSDAAFVRTGSESRVTDLAASQSTEEITSGVERLEILKTSHSAFTGYLRDEVTTLPETRDRLLGTAMNTYWRYRDGTTDFNGVHAEIRHALLRTFSGHESESVQHTLYEMGQAILAQFEVVEEIRIAMPNKHRLLVDLARFGMDNRNQIFVPTEEPSGYIEARLGRRPLSDNSQTSV